MKYIKDYCTRRCFEDAVENKLQCNCGENVKIFDWCWSNSDENVVLTNQDKDVLFHPVYSTGTAIVKGEKPFKPNKVYYWEVKILSKLYGTGVMMGIGTSNINPIAWKFRFCNILGVDSESWGYSHHGFIQQNNLVKEYGIKFGIGFLIGAYLDMCKGTLEFYVNRKSQGTAFTGLKSRELYPMLSSTVADSAVRTICAISMEDSLQLRCLELISKHPQLYKKFQQIPGLKKIYEKKYFWLCPSDNDEENENILKEKYKESIQVIKNTLILYHSGTLGQQQYHN